jgi:lipoate-protein ligase A
VKTRGNINIIDFTSRDGWFNMALDYHLFGLCEAGCDDAFLRFYTWKPPALSLGFHEPERIIAAGAAREDGIDIVRRPTGGRVVLHKNDLTYAVVLPAEAAPGCGTGDAYLRISECLVEGLRPLSADLRIDRGRVRGSLEGARPCFASTSRYEITHGGRKVVGSAQRMGRRSVLQHGSIPVGSDYLEIADYLNGVDPERLRREVAGSTTCLEEIAGGGVNIGEIAQSLASAFTSGLGLRGVHMSPERYMEGTTELGEALRRGEYPVTYADKIT